MTLIELMIVLAIVSILVVVTINVFSRYALKGRRIDGINAILSISLAEERYRSTHSLYGTLSQAYSGVSASPLGYYSLAVSNVTATTYTITATAQGNQASDASNGTSCSTLTLAYSSGVFTKTPSICWPT